jgi:hypothetical protein
VLILYTTKKDLIDMEKKINALFGIQAVVVLWLGFLTFKQMGSSSSNALTQARAALDANGGNANTIKPLDASTQPASAAAIQTDPAIATTMTFEESTYDFGTLKETDKSSHVFKFKNTGDKPLTISSAQGSCGCTVPQYPKEPIPAGGTGEIKVEFDPKGKVGKQSKTVTVVANTIPASTILTINSEVIKTEGMEATAGTDKKSK